MYVFCWRWSEVRWEVHSKLDYICCPGRIERVDVSLPSKWREETDYPDRLPNIEFAWHCLRLRLVFSPVANLFVSTTLTSLSLSSIPFQWHASNGLGIPDL